VSLIMVGHKRSLIIPLGPGQELVRVNVQPPRQCQSRWWDCHEVFLDFHRSAMGLSVLLVEGGSSASVLG
jgi:hypothetical protein